MDEQIYLLPVPDACRALGIGRTKLYELVDTGELDRVKIGAKSLITRESVGRFVSKLAEAA